MSAEAKAILEAALLCAQQALGTKELLSLLGPRMGAGFGREQLAPLLAELQAEWQARGSLRLVEVASGWRFQTHGAVREALESLHPEKPRRYSRAAMETLAVIAYRQPVTRGDIEDIRGVVVSSDIIKQLEERGWIESIGHRDAPGRPQLYATTKAFLDDLGLASLSSLPALDEVGGTPVSALLPEPGPLQTSLLELAEAPAEPEVELEVEPDAMAELDAETPSEAPPAAPAQAPTLADAAAPDLPPDAALPTEQNPSVDGPAPLDAPLDSPPEEASAP